jgi:hypothetical protein
MAALASLGDRTPIGYTCGSGSATVSSLWDSFVLGGYPISCTRNLNALLVMKSCSAKPTISCQLVMDLSRTLRTQCFMLRPLPHCLPCS